MLMVVLCKALVIVLFERPGKQGCEGGEGERINDC
jgi:hypothetical protein